MYYFFDVIVACVLLRLLAQLKGELAFEEQAKDGVEAELPAKVLADHAVVSNAWF